MVTFVTISLATNANAGALACRPAEADDYRDPQDRDGLSTLICDLPAHNEALIIVTDPSISWTVLITPNETVSFEDDMLGDKLELEGLPFFNVNADKVIHFVDPERLFISFTSNDPVTLEPTRIWLRIENVDNMYTIARM